MSGYTKVDNWLFDTVMPAAKPGTFKLVAAVYRATAGWRKEWAVISLSDFQQLSGTDGRHNVVAAVKDAIEHGWIERRPEGREFAYRVIVTNCDHDSHESLPMATGDSHESLLDESRFVTIDGHDSLPIDSHESLPPTSGTLKDKEKEQIKEIVESAVALSAPRTRKRGKGGEKQEKPIDPNTPFGVYKALEVIQRGINQGQALRDCKKLLEDGFTQEDIVNCGRFILSDPYFKERLVPLNTQMIVTRIDTWKEQGRPSTWVAPSTNGRHVAKQPAPGIPVIVSNGKGW